MNIPFIITIDTEGDNLWEKTEITTENALYLERFQELCNEFNLKPTWLTNYEMALDPVFVELGKQVIDSGTGEIGVHLHAWNSPPAYDLTGNDYFYKTLITDYPYDVAEKKLEYLVKLLEDTFGTTMHSHRSGRWAFDSNIATMVAAAGIKYDCSVTPNVNWKKAKGDPNGSGGPDYRGRPSTPFQFPTNDDSYLLEVPMTIQFERLNALGTVKGFLRSIGRMIKKRRLDAMKLIRNERVYWLRPNGKNLEQMKSLLDWAKKSYWTHVEFVLHSSEFMPDGSPTFPSEQSIEDLYHDMREIFAYAKSNGFYGTTLSEFGKSWNSSILANQTTTE